MLDNNKRPYPLVPNPTLFSINGANYLIDTNRVPHSIIGNNNISPLSTDVTVQSGLPVPNSTFTLGGLVYKYTEDAQRNLVTITGTKLYAVDVALQTFKLDSSLVFTINRTVPAAGTYPGTDVPIGTVRTHNHAQPLRRHTADCRRRLLHVQERPVHAAALSHRRQV